MLILSNDFSKKFAGRSRCIKKRPHRWSKIAPMWICLGTLFLRKDLHIEDPPHFPIIHSLFQSPGGMFVMSTFLKTAGVEYTTFCKQYDLIKKCWKHRIKCIPVFFRNFGFPDILYGLPFSKNLRIKTMDIERVFMSWSLAQKAIPHTIYSYLLLCSFCMSTTKDRL